MTTILKNYLYGFVNKLTRDNYCNGIKLFLSWKYNTTYVDIDIIAEDLERYLNANQDCTEDIINYINYCKNDRKLSTQTAHTHLKPLKQLLRDNGKTYNAYKIRKKTPITINLIYDRIPSPEDVKTIILNAKPLMKSFLLFLCCTGLRIDELLRLTPDNITEKDGIGIIYIVQESSSTKKHRRIALCTPECMKFYKEWMKIRDNHIKRMGTNHFCKNRQIDDKHIFPFRYNTAKSMLWTTLKESGLYKFHDGTNRRTVHFHVFRKYYDTQCLMSGISDTIRHLLMGHKLKGMDSVYVNPSEEMLINEYKKVIPKLTVLQDVEAINQLNLYKTKFEKQEGSVELLLDERKDQRSIIETLQKQITGLQAQIDSQNETSREMRGLLDNVRGFKYEYEDQLNDVDKTFDFIVQRETNGIISIGLCHEAADEALQLEREGKIKHKDLEITAHKILKNKVKERSGIDIDTENISLGRDYPPLKVEYKA